MPIAVVNARIRDTRAAAGQVRLDWLLTQRFPLDAFDQAYATLAAKPFGFVKAIIDLLRRPRYVGQYRPGRLELATSAKAGGRS